MLRRLFHANICVSDMERSLRFYERLGFTKVADMMLGGGEPGIGVALGTPVKVLRGVFMRLGDDPSAPVIDLVQFIDPPHQGEPYSSLNHLGICRLAFLVEDIEAVCEQLRVMEAEFVAPLHYYDGPGGNKIGIVCFKDPDGTVLELISEEVESMLAKAGD